MALEIRQQIKIKGSALSEDPILYFDNTGPATSLAAITVDSFGAGSTGEMIFQNAQSGTLTQALRIVQSGEVYIGSGTIDSSAVLQVDSTTKGFLVPRTPDPGTNISTPANGLMAYDSTDNELQYYNGTSWVSLTDSDGIYGGSGSLTSATTVDLAGFNLYFTDGDISIGTATPKGTGGSIPKLTVANGDSGVGITGLPIDTSLIVENNSTSYIGVLSPDTELSGIYLGSPSDSFGTSFTWSFDTKETILASRVVDGTVNIIVGNKNEPSITLTSQDAALVDPRADMELFGSLTLSSPNNAVSNGNTNSIANILRFYDADSVITPGFEQFIGKIEFKGNETSGPGVKGYIGGVQDDSGDGSVIFATTDGAGNLVGTDPRDLIGEKVRINSSGSMGIGTGPTIDVSSILQVDSLTKGFLPPRNPDPGTNISTPANGLMAFDSTDNELQYYNGTSWVSITSGDITSFSVEGDNGTPFTITSGDTIDFVGFPGINVGVADPEVRIALDYTGADSFILSATDGTGITVDGANDKLAIYDNDALAVKYVNVDQLGAVLLPLGGGTMTGGIGMDGNAIQFTDAFIQWDEENTMLNIDGSGTYDGVYIGNITGDRIEITGSDIALASDTGDAGAYAINNATGGSLSLQLKAATTFNSTLEVPEASGTIALSDNAIVQTGVTNFGPSSSAINISTTSIVKITNNGSAQSPTIGAGTDGQRVIFCVVAEGSPAAGAHNLTTSGASSAGWTQINLANIGESVELLYDTTVGWIIVGSYGVGIS